MIRRYPEYQPVMGEFVPEIGQNLERTLAELPRKALKAVKGVFKIIREFVISEEGR